MLNRPASSVQKGFLRPEAARTASRQLIGHGYRASQMTVREIPGDAQGAGESAAGFGMPDASTGVCSLPALPKRSRISLDMSKTPA